jgi:hypothetical protein
VTTAPGLGQSVHCASDYAGQFSNTGWIPPATVNRADMCPHLEKHRALLKELIGLAHQNRVS